MDIRVRIDELLRTPKTILGDAIWKVGSKPETRVMRRILLEDGEAKGAELISHAYPTTVGKEFRHLIVYRTSDQKREDGRCITRLDCAREIDGPHINDFGGILGYPPCKVDDVHYHDWAGNRHLAKATELPKKLLYARNLGSKINNIDDGFWWFCEQNQIVATKLDLPGWPKLDIML